jgi:hypothetical protein
MVLSGVLGLRDAERALDYQIIFTIAAALALGAAMQETGGAAFLAHMLLVVLDGVSPAVMLSAFFLLVGGLANIISTKATAVLFTPIAVEIAQGLGVSVEIFAVAVIFAANCSFASRDGPGPLSLRGLRQGRPAAVDHRLADLFLVRALVLRPLVGTIRLIHTTSPDFSPCDGAILVRNPG